MELKYGFISCDDHVQEHPEVWTKRMAKEKWGDRIPHVERQADGTERWLVDGKPVDNMDGVAIAGGAMPDRALEPQRWEDVPKAAYSPRDRLTAMDVDGVDYSVLYPSVAGRAGETFGNLKDADLELACVQAYNDFLVEEWGSVSKRFIPQCIVPLVPDAAAKEIRRCVDKGHRGVVMPSVPMMLREVPHINEPSWDPIWQACQDLNVPVCFHAGVTREIQFPPYSGFSPELASAMEALTRPVSTVLVVANFLYARILERFPKLKVIFSETSLAWCAYELELADHQFERQRLHNDGYDTVPSVLFKRQCHMVGWYDSTGLKTREHTGLKSLLWSTNFPQSTSTWPESRQTIERCFDGIPDNERRQVLVDNAAKLYNIA